MWLIYYKDKKSNKFKNLSKNKYLIWWNELWGISQNFSIWRKHFAKTSQGVSKIFHEVILRKILLQTKCQVKSEQRLGGFVLYCYEKNEVSDISFQAFYTI